MNWVRYIAEVLCIFVVFLLYTVSSDTSKDALTLLADARVGNADSIPTNFVSAGPNLVYFTVLSGHGKRALWVSDGTPDGTKACIGEANTRWLDVEWKPLKIYVPDPTTTNIQQRGHRRSIALIWADRDSVWMVGGINSDPTIITRLSRWGGHTLSSRSALTRHHFALVQNKLYLMDGDALVVLSGSGFSIRQTIAEGIKMGHVLHAVGTKVLFHGIPSKSLDNDPILWALNTRTNRVERLTILRTPSIEIGDFDIREGILYFTAPHEKQRDLWCTDGTRRGTIRLTWLGKASLNTFPLERLAPKTTDIRTAPKKGAFFEKIQNSNVLFVNVNATLCFLRVTEKGGLDCVERISGGFVGGGYTLGKNFIFSAHTPNEGTELWISDGTHEGTRLLADIVPGQQSSSPRFHGVLNRKEDGGGYALLSINNNNNNNGASGWWITDGTTRGTLQLRYDTGTPGASPRLTPRALFVGGDRAYFRSGGRFWRLRVRPEGAAGPPYALMRSNNIAWTDEYVRPPYTAAFTKKDGWILENEENGDEILILRTLRSGPGDGIGVEPYAMKLEKS